MNETSKIKINIAEIKNNIKVAAEKSGRELDDIKIVAVTKKIEEERIKKVIEEGIIDLGESKVQELLNKAENIEDNCKWHFIGHLQKNKVKYIIDKVELIHSVDNLGLALEIQKRAESHKKNVDILIQVNVSEEKTKYGVKKEETEAIIREISKHNNTKIRGLMTIAPNTENKETIRQIFRDLRKIFIDIQMKKIHNVSMDFLSMGMSSDYSIAIEEGANIVRIGTSVFE